VKKCLFIVAKMIYRGAGVVRILVVLLDGNQRWTQGARVKRFYLQRRERLHGVMQQDLETCGPLGQVGNWVL
jgi:hypothetical protein